MASPLKADRKRTPDSFWVLMNTFSVSRLQADWVLISEWAHLSQWARFNWWAWLFVRHFLVFVSLKCEKEKKIWGKGLERTVVRGNTGVCACVYRSVCLPVPVVCHGCVFLCAAALFRQPVCDCVPPFSLGGYGVRERADSL